MNREQARLELDATTLRPQEASDEVRDWLQGDVKLGEWYRARVAFDEQVAAAMEEVMIPAGLREKIVSGSRESVKRPVRWFVPTMAAALAACVVLGWVFLWPDGEGMPSWQAESLVAVSALEHGLSRLDDRSGSLEAVKRVLVGSGSILPEKVPGVLGDLPTLGCKRVRIGGRPATIVCFKLPTGGEAHLVVLESAGLGGKMPEGRAKFEQRKNWSLASWSDGGQTYLLATTAGEKELRRLMGEA